MKTKFFSLLTLCFCMLPQLYAMDKPIPGSWRTELYMPILKGSRVAVAGNHTSMIGNRHLVDTLLRSGIDVVKVFSPEHGFRGLAADGELVASGTDEETGLPVISLYGSTRRPTQEQLEDVDILLFDIQDVGTRFYTYISTMTYLMEEAARAEIPVIILDRPNPNGHYIDGPILDPQYASFVGLHEVPVVHGMTVGEYALMVNGEGWLEDDLICSLTVIEVDRYSRQTRYSLPRHPSPNLPNMTAIYLYPSLCFFEGTTVSIGRGTQKPFQKFGHPNLPSEVFSHRFTPQSLPASPTPPQMDRECLGKDLSIIPIADLQNKNQINLNHLLKAYQHFTDKDNFFLPYFERLAGTSALRKQIEAGYTADEIRATWEEGLGAFKALRANYLLYPDGN